VSGEPGRVVTIQSSADADVGFTSLSAGRSKLPKSCSPCGSLAAVKALKNALSNSSRFGGRRDPRRAPNSRRANPCAIPKAGRAVQGPRPTLWQRCQPVTIRMQRKERKVSFPEAMIQVAKDKALKGDQRAAQTLINLMRELDILKPQEVLSPPEIHIHFVEPGDKIKG
jgi:hypothetical protein